MPSFAMIGVITSAAIGSAHHHPKAAFNPRPQSNIAERYVQKSVCRESACIAELPNPAATFRLARASSGMMITEAAAIAIPTKLR